MNKKIVAVGIAAILVVGGFVGANAFGATEQSVDESGEIIRQILVDTRTPEVGNITVTGEYIGVVEPNQQVAVISKATGEVLEAYYNVGDYVEAGDILAEVDSYTLRNNIAQLQAGLSSAAALGSLGLNSAERNQSIYYNDIEAGYNTSLVSAQANVDAAELGVQQANNTLRTIRKTYNETKDEGMADDATLDNLRNQRVQAELALENAQNVLEQAKLALEITQKSVEEGKANIDDSVTQARINADTTQLVLQLEQAQKSLADYSIKAPISGIIEQRNVDPFDMTQTGSPVYVISNKNAMIVSFKISEAAYSHVQMGDIIAVEKNGNTSTGVIMEISTMVDAGGLFTVKASVENPPADLYTGSAVKIFADTQKARSVMMIPLSALYYDNGIPFVYVAEGEYARRVEVEVGIYDSEYIEIMSGLSASDRIITTWSPNLADGALITLASGETASAGTAPAGEEQSAEEQAESALEEMPATMESAADEATEAEQETAGDPDENDETETLPEEAENDSGEEAE